MTFQDGTVIGIEDYRLPRDWKTHFYLHSTTGTLSPASILRIGEDARTTMCCYVDAVYPLDSTTSWADGRFPRTHSGHGYPPGPPVGSRHGRSGFGRPLAGRRNGCAKRHRSRSGQTGRAAEDNSLYRRPWTDRFHFTLA